MTPAPIQVKTKFLTNNVILIIIGVFAAICLIISLIFISHKVHVAQSAIDASRKNVQSTTPFS